MKCDWSGEPGPAPTSDELCQAHVGKNAKGRLQCQEMNKVRHFFNSNIWDPVQIICNITFSNEGIITFLMKTEIQKCFC